MQREERSHFTLVEAKLIEVVDFRSASHKFSNLSRETVPHEPARDNGKP